MKNIAFLLFVIVLFFSCEKDDRITGESVTFFVNDAAGNNLLDPAVEGNILDNEIYADYNGERFQMLNTPKTRVLPAYKWFGLCYSDYGGYYPSRIWFGEFYPPNNIKGETFILNWGDGTSSEVKFDLYVKGRKTVVRRLWLDGELVSDDSLVARIVK